MATIPRPWNKDNPYVEGDMRVEGDLYVGGTTTIVGAQAFTGDVTMAGSLTVTGASLGKRYVWDTGGVYATPIALTEAMSGRIILSDDAAGLDFTLPAVGASQIGIQYQFKVNVTLTSNNLRVTAAAGDLLRGGVYIQDFDTASTGAYFTPDESDDLIFAMNGTTKGGKKGSAVTFTAITATGWFVEGLLFGDGTLATPFS